MAATYVIYRPCDGSYVRHGRRPSMTGCLNFAKHFCNRWGAEQQLKRLQSDFLGLVVKQIILD